MGRYRSSEEAHDDLIGVFNLFELEKDGCLIDGLNQDVHEDVPDLTLEYYVLLCDNTVIFAKHELWTPDRESYLKVMLISGKSRTLTRIVRDIIMECPTLRRVCRTELGSFLC